jgi:prophage maintenance system killer protein
VTGPLQTLTVQDFLWLNQQIARGQQRWNFLRLEEAVNYQYAYGSSRDVFGQAARLARGWRRMRPFQIGNDATGFAGLAAFLAINGWELQVEDAEAAEWYRGVQGAEEIQDRCAEAHRHLHHGVPPIQEAMTEILFRYPLALAALLGEEEPVPIGNFSSSRLTAELS